MAAQPSPFLWAPDFVVAVARVTPPNARLLGTASIVSPGKFVTVNHVTGGMDRDLAIVLPRHRTLSEYQDTSDTQVKTRPVRVVSSDPVHDLCVMELDTRETFVGPAIASTDAVNVGDEVVILGFPHSADAGRMVLTLQKAEVGAKILVDCGGVKAKHLVLNIQSRPGQSGSPVIDPRTGSVVALLVGSYAPGGGGGISLGGVDPHTLHQTTHAVSAEYLQGML